MQTQERSFLRLTIIGEPLFKILFCYKTPPANENGEALFGPSSFSLKKKTPYTREMNPAAATTIALQ